MQCWWTTGRVQWWWVLGAGSGQVQVQVVVLGAGRRSRIVSWGSVHALCASVICVPCVLCQRCGCKLRAAPAWALRAGTLADGARGTGSRAAPGIALTVAGSGRKSGPTIGIVRQRRAACFSSPSSTARRQLAAGGPAPRALRWDGSGQRACSACGSAAALGGAECALGWSEPVSEALAQRRQGSRPAPAAARRCERGGHAVLGRQPRSRRSSSPRGFGDRAAVQTKKTAA